MSATAGTSTLSRPATARRRPIRRGAWLAAAALMSALAAPFASAHQEPYSHIDIHVEEGGLSGALVAHVVDLAHETGIATPDSLLDAAFLGRSLSRLQAMLDEHLVLLADGHTVRAQWRSASPLPERGSVRFEWTADLPRAPGALELHGPLFPYDPPHETYVNLFERGALRQQALLDHRHPSLIAYTGTPQGVGAVAQVFVLHGIHHIVIGPDHILFIVGLLLLGGSFGRLLKIVSAFTLAHSMTLALSVLGIVRLSSRIVEPAIALSIIVVGLDTMRSLGTRTDRRAWIAFGFGFIHGFGFANVLTDLGLPPNALGVSLAAFNVGVEIGQAAIVALAAPLLSAVQARRPELGRPIVFAGAAIVVLAGAWWLVERTLLSPA